MRAAGSAAARPSHQPSSGSQHLRPAQSAARQQRAGQPVNPGRTSAFSPDPVQAQAYRRTDDGSGYRPIAASGASGARGDGKRKGGKGGKRGPWRVVFWIALAVFVVCLGILGVLGFSYWQGQNAYDEIAEQAIDIPDDVQGASLDDLQVDWDALRAINPDVVGWIYIPDTVVNYPIVHTDNDDHYLYYDFNGQQGLGATFGTIFLQAANAGDFTDANNIIYGHHLNNGSMFAILASLMNQDDFNAHRTVYLLTPQGNYKLTTFSLVHCAADDPLAQVAFADDAAQAAYVQDKIDRSEVEPSGTLPAAQDIDHTFALVTCDNLPSDGRYVLFAYVAETTVPGQHAAGQAPSASDAGAADQRAADETTDEGAAANAVSDASEELAAA